MYVVYFFNDVLPRLETSQLLFSAIVNTHNFYVYVRRSVLFLWVLRKGCGGFIVELHGPSISLNRISVLVFYVVVCLADAVMYKCSL